MNSVHKGSEKDDFEVINITVKPDLYSRLNLKSKELMIEESNFIHHCIQTGLMLGEIDSVFHKKMLDDTAVWKRLLEAHGYNKGLSNIVQGSINKMKNATDDEESNKNDKTETTNSENDYKILRVRVDSDFYDEIKKVTNKLNIEISSFVKYCIRTGLYLEDLNLYLSLKEKEKRMKK